MRLPRNDRGISSRPGGRSRMLILALLGAGLACAARGQVFTEFPVPTADSRPSGIAAGPDGNLWFTECDGNQIGRITTGGVITEFPIPTASSGPQGITAGPDGNLWFTEAGQPDRADHPGRGDHRVPDPHRRQRPDGIAAGPDGNLWFTEADGNRSGGSPRPA